MRFLAEIRSVKSTKTVSGDKTCIVQLIIQPGANVTGALEALIGEQLVTVTVEPA